MGTSPKAWEETVQVAKLWVDTLINPGTKSKDQITKEFKQYNNDIMGFWLGMLKEHLSSLDQFHNSGNI